MQVIDPHKLKALRHECDLAGTVVQGRVIAADGVSLMHVEAGRWQQIADALKLLRGFRATSRRVVLCDGSALEADGREISFADLGRAMVEAGNAELLICTGTGGRQVALAARDAGLPLSAVIVCSDTLSAGKVLLDRLLPGDMVLLVGADAALCRQLGQPTPQFVAETAKVAA